MVERRTTPRGELVLRRAGEHFEIISNGVFLMDTRVGSSEELLVRAGLGSRSGPTRVLIGGLGVGFSLREALRHPQVVEITVVEVEPAVIDWQHRYLAGFSGNALDDPRVRVVCADLLDWLGDSDDAFDVVCVDIDNGPQWTVTARNASLYSFDGLRMLSSRLADGGTVTVWSACADEAFFDRLAWVFGNPRRHLVPVERGEPDVVYVAGAGSGGFVEAQ